MEITKQFQTKCSISVTIFIMLNVHSHVFNSDINKDKPQLMNDVKPFIWRF